MRSIKFGLSLMLSLAILSFAVTSLHALPIGTIVLTEADSIDPVTDTGVEVQFEFFFDANTLSVDVYNNSSTDFAPGISEFGFDLGLTGLTFWQLTAFDAAGGLATIGSNVPPTGNDVYYWRLNVPVGGGNYFANTFNGKDGFLYNPQLLQAPPPPGAGVLPSGWNTNFFTKATLELVFDEGADLSNVDLAFAKLQNVGPGGAGSRNLVGSGANPIPEPATFLLLGTGILGVVGISRWKHNKKGK